MGMKDKPEALKTLHQILGDAFTACDYQAERRPYAPHVTLMRKLIKPGQMEKFEPITWRVNEFALVESVAIEGGVRYEVLRTYPLL